jgi:hypothetical protein
MPIANTDLSKFLAGHATNILEMSEIEGFSFSLRESDKCVTAECTLPDGTIRYIIFEDHRVSNPHGEKPHVCNQWHKALGKPISFTMGKEIVENDKRVRILSACAIMCITQTSAYKEMKEAIFA